MLSIAPRLTSIAYHRNGVAGAGYYALRFTRRVEAATQQLFVVAFPEGDNPPDERIAVFTTDGEDATSYRLEDFRAQILIWVRAYDDLIMLNARRPSTADVIAYLRRQVPDKTMPGFMKKTTIPKHAKRVTQ